MHTHLNSQGKKRREKTSVLSLFLKVDRKGAEVTLGGRLGKFGHQLSRVSGVLVVTAATIRSTICFAVHLRIVARFLLVSLIHCVPQVENVPMVLN